MITAEGQLDSQTAYGKSVESCRSHSETLCIARTTLAGSLGEDYQAVYNLGVDAVAVLPSKPMTLTYAMEHAAQLAADATERAHGCYKPGAK